MRYLIHSEEGDGAVLAWRLLQEGNDVDLYIKDPNLKAVYQGICPRLQSLEEGLSHDPDVIVFDMCGDGKKADQLRKSGHRVIGGSSFQDLLELDRGYAMKLAEKTGISVPPYEEFDSLDEAIEFVDHNQKRYVLKPNGNEGTSLTYVSKDPEDMIGELAWLKQEENLRGRFMLQEFIEGVEISTECWYSNGKYVGTANGTLEQKKFMDGDLGPNTGCQSSWVWGYSEGTKISDRTLGRLDRILEGVGYTGPLDVNSIVAQDGNVYFLEFTPRFGYSAICALMLLLKEDFGKVIHDFASGTAEDLELDKDISLMLSLSMPPYPLETDLTEIYKRTENKKMLNIQPLNVFPVDCMMKDGELTTAGTSGLVCYAGCSGDDHSEVNMASYTLSKSIEFPDKQYRTDARRRINDAFPKLKSLGFEVPQSALSPVLVMGGTT